MALQGLNTHFFFFLQKTMSNYHRAQAQYDTYVDINIKHSVAWQRDGHIDLEKMRNDRLGKKYFMSESQFERKKGKYDRIRDKHEEVITALKGVSNSYHPSLRLMLHK